MNNLLGAYDKDRKLGKEGITAAGLLMFGNYLVLMVTNEQCIKNQY
ncbi:hypothetical protein KQI45_04015 [Clostridium sporogenes]|nr:hypothetical protein [Clostridium sporogenes]MBU5299243.1 hypothetical protein [Clostridium sporogenes]